MTRPKPPQMRASPGKRYGFNCVYCSSRLEATESMAGEDGQCPTCGNQITIPILDRYNRLIDPKTREVIKQDPHPVHAYAAAGERAPKIDRDDTGVQHIICPKCRASSPISANNCRGCGVPFTLEGTSLDTGGNSNGLCVASLVLGILGLPMHVLILPSLLAVVLGLVGTQQVKRGTGSGSGLALAGMICGAIGLMLGAVRLVAG